MALTQPWLARLLASCNVARRKRRQLRNRRVPLHNVKDVSDDDNTRLVRLTHTVTDEPAAICRMNDLAGWLSSVENRALHHSSECHGKDVPVEGERDGAVNFRTVGHGRSLSDRRAEVLPGSHITGPHIPSLRDWPLD